MITQSEFLSRIGIGHTTLVRYQERGKFLPKFKTPTGKRVYYDERQVDEFKICRGLSVKEFSDKTDIALSTLYSWNESGRLVADHTDTGGHLRYSYDQVDKYFAGDYDGVREDGFIDRSTFANLVGVSEATIISWANKGRLLPDHKTITRKWQYRPEQVEEAKKLRRVKREVQ